jgi:hypothetical protein
MQVKEKEIHEYTLRNVLTLMLFSAVFSITTLVHYGSGLMYRTILMV